MSISGTIANSVIKITLDGFAKCQQQMNSLRIQGEVTIAAAGKAGNAASEACKEASKEAAKATGTFTNLNKSILAISGIFAGASVAVRSFAAAADPRGALELELAFLRLQIAIGRMFIPIIREAANKINQLAAYLNGMSNETRESVLRWTKLGLAVGGAAAGLAALVGIGGQVVGGLAPIASVLATVGSAFWRILGFLGPWGRLIVVIGSVAAALFGLRQAGSDVSGTFGKLAQFAKNAWETLKAGFTQIVAAVSPVLTQLEHLLEGLGEKIVGGMGKAWGQLAPLAQNALSKLAPILSAVFSAVVPVVSALTNLLGGVFTGLQLVGAAQWKVILEIISRQFQSLGKLIEAVKPLLGKFGEALSNLFAGEQGEALQKVFEFIASAIESTLPVVTLFFDTLDKAIEDTAPALQRLASEFDSLFAGGSSNPFAGWAEALQPVFAYLQTVAENVKALFAGGDPFASWREGLQPVLGLLTSMGSAAQTVWAAFQRFNGAVFAGLSAQVEKLRPSLERVGEVFRTVFDYASEKGKAVADVLAGIASRVGPPLLAVFERVGVLFQKLFELGSGLATLIGNTVSNGFDKLAAAVGPVIDWLGDKVQWLLDKLVDGFNAVWGPIKDGIAQIAKWFLWLSFRVEEYFVKALNAVLSVINSLIDGVNSLIDKINKVNKLNPVGNDIDRVGNIGSGIKATTPDDQNKQFAEVEKVTREAKQAQQPQPKPVTPIKPLELPQQKPDKGEQKKDNNQFQGQSIANARFIGVAEAMRAAQQSTVPTRESVQLAEINRQLGQQGQVLEGIRDNTGKQPNLGLGR